MIRIITSIFLLLLYHSLHAQVQNDNANKAQPLIVNASPYPSDTRNCTLEEKCIDRKLTAKCLVYHNDQWFTFTTGKDSVYYISIRNQHCEDVNGVQLQVMEGHLCRPSTYAILECISLATQDDIYVTLRNLKHHYSYILNVDGYLHDLCKFEIGITTTLPDFAVTPLSRPQDLNGIQKNGKVFLEWKLTDELHYLKTERFEVRRRFEQEKKFYSLTNIEVDRTVHGDSKREYQYVDTVGRKGFYYYQIIAITADSLNYLIGEHIAVSRPMVQNAYEQLIELPCKDKTAITFIIYNWEDDRFLDKMQTLYSNGTCKINFASYFQPGILRLKVVAIDKDNKKIKDFFIDRKY